MIQLVKYTIKPDFASTFTKAAKDMLTHSLNEQGNVAMKLYVDAADATTLYLYSQWESEAALRSHEEESYSKGLKLLADMALTAPPEVMNLTITEPAPDHGSKTLDPEDEGVTLLFIFKIKAGFREKILERFETHVAESRKEQGCIIFDMYTIDGVDDTFVVYEQWRSKSDLYDVHFNQPHSEITGALMQDAMAGTMEEYMHFVTEIIPERP